MGRQRCRLYRQFPPLPLLRDEDVIEQQPDLSALIERYVEDATIFLRANSTRPFFLYLAPFQVHLPLYAPDRFVRESHNGRYGACVEAVDWAVGVLLHELARLDLDRRTLVIFTSDNGSRGRDEGGSNAPLRGTKATCWEGGQRVPFIARWPGRVPAGAVCRDLAASMDLLPTLVRLAGDRVPDDRALDGREMPALLGGAAAQDGRDVFFYYEADRLTAVREGPWKLFVRTPPTESADGPWGWRPGRALYHLADDIGETTNVTDRHPDVVTRLMKRIEDCREDLGDAEVGAAGRNRRPVGRANTPRPLTVHDPAYPYLMAEYDLSEAG
jgi:arylsulfatase A-like enzyme